MMKINASQVNNKVIMSKYETLLNNNTNEIFTHHHKFVVKYNQETNILCEKSMIIETKLKNSLTNQLMCNLYYDFLNNRLNCDCRICRIFNSDSIKCHHLKLIVDKFNDDTLNSPFTSSNVSQRFDVEIKAMEKVIQKRRQLKTISILNSLESSLKDTDTLTLNEKATLIPEFKLSDNNLNLSLKIGINKFYIVKNIYNLITNINEKALISYGKDLTFTHSYDNFDERSKKLIDILQFIRPTEYTINKKDLCLTKQSIDLIFNIYHHQFVNFEDIDNKYEIFIALDEFNSKIRIENNHLVCDDLDEETKLFEGNDNLYLLKNKCIYKVGGSADFKVLLLFIYNNPNFEFEYAKDAFFEKLYARFCDEIEPDENFTSEFKLKDLKIESYFDMDDNLTLESVYYIDGEKCSLEKMEEDKVLSQKLSKYLSIINNLGFVNGEIKDTSLIASFVRADLSKLKEISQVYLSEKLKAVRVTKMKRVTFSLSYDTGMLDFVFDNLNYTDSELYKILNAIKRKVRFVKLNNNTIIDVESIEAKQLFNTVSEFDLDAKHLTKKQVVPLYQSLKLLNNEDKFSEFSTDEIIKKMLYDIAHYKEQPYKAPSKLQGVMRDYQVDAYKWMKTLVKYRLSGILADDMGLGKTLEVISLILDDKDQKPSLIVCPKSLSFNWTNEFNKWDTGIDVVNIVGTQNNRKSIIEHINLNKKRVYISSYDSLKNDLMYYGDKAFKYIILDEAQFIKNHTTLKARAVKELNSELRFVLTGTPIENTIMDLWSIFDFILPNYLYGVGEFRAQYEQGITKIQDQESIDSLVKKITPFILRRTKEDVLKDLPEKIETIMFAEMSDTQRKYYEAEVLKIKNMISSDTTKLQILSSLTRLRQLCVDPSLYIDNYQGPSAKMDLAIEEIKDLKANNHRVLIFSQFTKALDLLAKRLDDEKIKYYMLTGSTEAEERVNLANKFNSKHSDVTCFLISLKAGGTGLNLVGADTVIHLDPWWNVAAENQATDRAHRIGQKHIVRVIKLVCEKTIEQKVIELQQIKSKIASSVISNNDENIIKLDNQDLKFLLE